MLTKYGDLSCLEGRSGVSATLSVALTSSPALTLMQAVADVSRRLEGGDGDSVVPHEQAEGRREKRLWPRPGEPPGSTVRG